MTRQQILSADILDGAVGTADLADGAVTSAKILDATIATGDLADNAVTTAKLAGSAAQQYVNGQLYTGVWSAAAAAWSVTPLTFTGVFSGAMVRLETSLSLTGPVGGYTHLNFICDGSIVGGSPGPIQTFTGQYHNSSLTMYHQPPAGTHTYAVQIYASVAGIGTVNGVACTFYINEQKR